MTSSALPTNPQPTHPTNNLFPCLVCYPGTSNYSLVWLPINMNSATAATLNPSILNSLISGASPQTTPQKQPTTSSIASCTSSPVQATSDQSSINTAVTTTCTTSAGMDATPTLNSNPLLANNLSAAITQSYLQLLQLQQLQQQAIVQQHMAKSDPDSANPTPSLDLSLSSVSSLLSLPSIGGPSTDILTQAVAGSIPSTTNPAPRPLNLSSLASATQSSGIVHCTCKCTCTCTIYYVYISIVFIINLAYI